MARTRTWLCLALALTACTDSGSTYGPTDRKVPEIGDAITFSNIASSRVTVNWGAAEDDWTSTASVRYKLVRAAEASEIDTVAEVDAVRGPDLLLDYQRGVTSRDVTDLEFGKTYAFAVAVRDGTGNTALYEPATVTTLDTSAPTPGASIGFTDIRATSLTVNWGVAKDDVTPEEQLEYKVVMASRAAAIDTLEEVRAITRAPELVQDFTAGITAKAVAGLSSSVGYAFAVVVRDEQGNEAIYTPMTVATPDVVAPSIGTPITFSNIATTSLVVRWGQASDTVTSVLGLRYKVVSASDPAAIDTLEEVDAISSGERLVQDFAPGIISVLVMNLTPATSYAFAVVVRDLAGNRALYAPASVATRDPTAPSAGTPIVVSGVNANGLNLSWGQATDNFTPQASLQYKVVRAANAAAIDTADEVGAITTGDGLVQDFTAGLLAATVTGLSPGTSYAFAVVVRDQQGNLAIYTPVTQSTLDNGAPVPGTPLSFGDITTSSLTVSWGRATDGVSSQADLEYKLVRAADASSIDTIGEVDAIGAVPGLVMDFSRDVVSRGVAGLSASTSYAFALLVRDAAGNRALYAPATASTLDISAPSSGAAISASNITATAITFTWGAGSDDVTPQGALTYKAVLSTTAAAIDTLAEIDAITLGPGLISDYIAGLTSVTVSGLTSSTQYAFAVAVRDQAGNRALYSPLVRATLDVTAPTLGAVLGFNDVTDTSVGVAWGAASDDVSSATELQYKVVRASQASDIDTLDEVRAIASGPNLVQDFTANITAVEATGLTSATEYFFAVVVRDAAGNEALYAPDNIVTLDISAPTPGLALSFSDIAATGMTVSWGAASDDLSDASTLEYKLVRAPSAADIDSLAEVDAIVSGPELIADFTAELTSWPVTGLASSTTYAFAVVVRDEAGNEALYAPATQATLDVSAPVPGTGLSFDALTATSVTVSWGAASDDVTATASLEYKLVRAASAADIDSLAEVDAITSGPELIADFTAALTSSPVTGLTASTPYAFAVAVRDAADNRALYAPATVTTASTCSDPPILANDFCTTGTFTCCGGSASCHVGRAIDGSAACFNYAIGACNVVDCTSDSDCPGGQVCAASGSVCCQGVGATYCVQPCGG